MAISLIANASAKAASSGAAATTGAINTTGATLLVIWLCNNSTASSNNPTFGAISDSKGNVWTPGPQAFDTTWNNPRGQFFFCFNPIVGSGHTFTVGALTSGFATIFAAAFSGTNVGACLDQVSAGHYSSGATSNQPGSITPQYANELVLAGLLYQNTSNTISVDSSFAITDQQLSSAASFGGCLAWKVQTSATAENPTFSWTGSAGSLTIQASFIQSQAAGILDIPPPPLVASTYSYVE